MRQTMARTTLALALALAAAAELPHPTGAAEKVDVKPPAAPKLTKAERIEKLKQTIFRAEKIIRDVTEERIARMTKQDPKTGEQERRARDSAIAKLPGLRTELGWLEGRITLAKAESAAKAAAEAMAKAGEAEKPSAQTALDAAQAELALVKKLEESKEF